VTFENIVVFGNIYFSPIQTVTKTKWRFLPQHSNVQKIWTCRDSNPRSTALEMDAMTTMQINATFLAGRILVLLDSTFLDSKHFM
jgi:hypothetical protein